jgi:hypothetical protein
MIPGDTMRKLKLDLDQITVDSFDPNPSEGVRRGTVQGFGPTPVFTCPLTCDTCYNTCASCDGTCENSCAGTCYYTCGGSCGGTCNEPTCITCQTNCEQDSCVYVCP